VARQDVFGKGVGLAGLGEAGRPEPLYNMSSKLVICIIFASGPRIG